MGGGGGEGGGERARARPHLQLVRVLARHACAGRGGAAAWTGRGGPAQRLQQLLGRIRFDPERKWGSRELRVCFGTSLSDCADLK